MESNILEGNLFLPNILKMIESSACLHTFTVCKHINRVGLWSYDTECPYRDMVSLNSSNLFVHVCDDHYNVSIHW